MAGYLLPGTAHHAMLPPLLRPLPQMPCMQCHHCRHSSVVAGVRHPGQSVAPKGVRAGHRLAQARVPRPGPSKRHVSIQAQEKDQPSSSSSGGGGDGGAASRLDSEPTAGAAGTNTAEAGGGTAEAGGEEVGAADASSTGASSSSDGADPEPADGLPALQAAVARVLAQLAGVAAAVAGFFKLLSGFLTGGPTWLRRQRLKKLAAAADEAPQDAETVAAYLRELTRIDPAGVVAAIEQRKYAVNAAGVAEYLKALVRSGEIAKYAGSGASAAAIGDHASMAALLDSLSARLEGREDELAAGSSVARPLHVLLRDGKRQLPWPLALLSSLVSGVALMVAASFLWLFGASVMRRYAAGLSAGSGVGAGMQGAAAAGEGRGAYAPKEYNKDVLPEKSIKRFKDVKGCDEAKAELEEIVEYLKNPDKFTRLGGKLPKGVLLTGPPGTGKTLLARATAGEAGVPFFYRAGSEFEEMFVGVGSRRVRSLFGAAKKKAPCIVFIDEIDAIGGNRKSWENHTRKTLNQLLVEMDGFEANEGVIVMACTNIPEALDPALTRPGRFDRTVAVPLPDVRGRQQILELYLEPKPRDAKVDADYVARQTPGFSGADLYNLVNEAALLAAKGGADRLTPALLDEARDKILMGAPRTSMVLTEQSRRLTAYHEAGHAVVALNTAGAKPIHKATILPRGHALGMVSQVPDGDQTSVTKAQLLAEIDVCMGGKVSEELVFGEDQVTTGARSDLQAATRVARHMVAQCGMGDEVGPVYVAREGEGAPGAETQRAVDREVASMLKASYTRVRALLAAKEADLHAVSDALLERETLTLADIRAVLAGDPLEPQPPAPASPPRVLVEGVTGEEDGGLLGESGDLAPALPAQSSSAEPSS